MLSPRQLPKSEIDINFKFLMAKKILLTATVQSHIAQFHNPLIELLRENGFEIHVAAKDNLAVKNGLKLSNVDKVFDIPFSRSPKNSDNLKAYKQLKEIINKENYSHIHCNTPMGGIITRLAAKSKRHQCSIIYTAHGFHFYKGASKKSWLLYYPIEKKFANITDKLICINQEDFELAKKKFKCGTFRIHGVGVNPQRYNPLQSEDENFKLREKLHIPKNAKIILSIGELLPNKNQIMAIRAMQKVAKEIPDALLLIAGNGPNQAFLEHAADEFGLGHNVKLIGYCTNLEEYQKISSIVVATSIREGLGLNVIEGMLSANPVVASHNRGHDELITDGKTGFLVNQDDSEAMASRILQLLNNEELRNSMGKSARESALQYSSDNVKEELRQIYGL